MRLATLAAGVWRAPVLDGATLASYQPKGTPSAVYTLADHPHLGEGPIRTLFEAFRTAVLALDPAVTEEFKKLYVAYKAETNFVDVIPQAKRLRLTLNLQFHELEDPRSVAKDVTGLGRWGNGDVEVDLAVADDLPYALGLVRQAFEKQMEPDA